MESEQRQECPLLWRSEVDLLAVDERLERAEETDLDRHTSLSTRRRPFVYPDLRYLEP